MNVRRRILGFIVVGAIAALPSLTLAEPLPPSGTAIVPVKYEGYRRCISECLDVYEELHQICTEIPIGETPQDTEDALDCYSSAAGFRAECTAQCRFFDLILRPPRKKLGLAKPGQG